MIAILEIVNTLLNAKKNGDIEIGDAFDMLMRVRNSDNSVATYARNNVCQFPLLCSTNLSLDACMRTAQILEQLYTVYIRMVITNNLDVIDLTSGENKAKLISRLHQNDKANYGLADSRDVERTFGDVLNSESVKIPFLTKQPVNKSLLKEANKELLKLYLENFNLGLLNGDMNNSNLAILKEDVCDEENIEHLIDQTNNVIRNINNDIARSANGGDPANAALRRGVYGTRGQNGDPRRNNAIRELETLSTIYKNLTDGNNKRHIAMQYGVSATRADASIRKNNELEPSLLEIDVTYNNANMMKSTKIAVGVKTIIHKIKSEEMRYYLAQSLIESKRLFRFFQWTTGEIKFLKDFVLDLSNTKDQATTDKKSVKWWRHLRTRKTASKIRAIGGNNPFLPNATVVFAREDVELIKISRHLDLMNDTKLASRLMDIYFLMHIVIVDESDDMIYIFNKDTDVWESYKFNKLANDIIQSLKQNTVLNLR